MPRFFVAVIYPQNGDLTKLLKLAQKKVPQSACLSAGGEMQKLFGQCPNACSMNLSGASLSRSRGLFTLKPNIFQVRVFNKDFIFKRMLTNEQSKLGQGAYLTILQGRAE